MATFNHGKKCMGHNLTFDRRSIMNCWIFVVTFFLLFHVGHGLEVCSWSDIPGPYIGATHIVIVAGTYSVPEPGCKMKKTISNKVDVTIEGVSGSFRELQSNRVDNQGVTAIWSHRHFDLTSPGKLTLNYLKLTWGETGSSGSGGFIYMSSGTLAINWVHFDGTKTTGKHAYSGGCINVHDGTVTIKESTFEGFRAANGGAIFVRKSTPMTIESTTFKNNDADVRLYLYSIYNLYLHVWWLNYILIVLTKHI